MNEKRVSSRFVIGLSALQNVLESPAGDEAFEPRDDDGTLTVSFWISTLHATLPT